jgi:hypothetical protein
MSVIPISDLINTVDIYTWVVDKYGDKKLIGTGETIKCRIDYGTKEVAFPPASTNSQTGENVSYDAVLHCNAKPLQKGFVIKHDQEYFECQNVKTIQDLITGKPYQFVMLKRNLNVEA